ncbi:hypothetical protein KC717_04350 [Candidatus Dojkabacteria bacterium]|uniref:Uncharacterized protein n=1 Tax=Candidatus Dojkabacteria bacterium TaxID=2099670 RepID=A0A955L874_9BACT|nr:hypothetical protein [Candidatus Dojkabacteria bacterium]
MLDQLQGEEKKAKDILSKFAEGDTADVGRVVKFVKEGHKLDNQAMQQLLYKLYKEEGLTYKTLLAIYLQLDKAVEEGTFTNDMFESLAE